MICQLPEYQSIIVLNSLLNPGIYPLLKQSIPILAADGAARHLIQAEIYPKYIIGDHDSFDGHAGNQAKIIKIEDENSTDFEKTILFARQQLLTPSLILGINGGELDHILGNSMTLLKYGNKQDLYCLDSYLQGNEIRFKLIIPLAAESLTLELPKNTLISIVPFEKTVVSSQGLRWELQNTILQPDCLISLRNQTLLPSVNITVQEGKSLLIIDMDGTSFMNL